MATWKMAMYTSCVADIIPAVLCDIVLVCGYPNKKRLPNQQKPHNLRVSSYFSKWQTLGPTRGPASAILSQNFSERTKVYLSLHFITGADTPPANYNHTTAWNKAPPMAGLRPSPPPVAMAVANLQINVKP